jgi:hypothetical protein
VQVNAWLLEDFDAAKLPIDVINGKKRPFHPRVPDRQHSRHVVSIWL